MRKPLNTVINTTESENRSFREVGDQRKVHESIYTRDTTLYKGYDFCVFNCLCVRLIVKKETIEEYWVVGQRDIQSC